MITFLDGPAAACKSLCLRRAPKFLRVVVNGKGVVDALDQLDDKPMFDEELYAYRLVKHEGTVHICARGKGARSGWFHIATYQMVVEQPSRATMWLNRTWQSWAVKQMEKESDCG